MAVISLYQVVACRSTRCQAEGTSSSSTAGYGAAASVTTSLGVTFSTVSARRKNRQTARRSRRAGTGSRRRPTGKASEPGSGAEASTVKRAEHVNRQRNGPGPAVPGLLQRDVFADALRLRRRDDQCGCRRVLYGHADRLVERYVLSGLSARSGSGDELTDLGVHMVSRDDPVADRHQQVVAAGRERRQRRVAGLHDDERVGDGGGVDLAPGLVEADGGDVYARRQPFAPDDRLGRMRGRARDVRTVERLAVGRDRVYLGIRRGRQLRRQCGRARRVTARDTDFLYRPYAEHRAHVRAGLYAGAKDREHGRAGTGADRRDRRTIQQSGGPAGLRIEHRDDSLMRGQRRTRVARKERDELAHEYADRRHEARHRTEQAAAFRYERRNPRRYRGTPGAEVGHRRGQGIDEQVQIEQGLDLHPFQHQHRPIVAERRASMSLNSTSRYLDRSANLSADGRSRR